MCSQLPALNLIKALWGDMEVELGQILGRVAGLEVLGAAIKTVRSTISGEKFTALQSQNITHAS